MAPRKPVSKSKKPAAKPVAKAAAKKPAPKPVKAAAKKPAAKPVAKPAVKAAAAAKPAIAPAVVVRPNKRAEKGVDVLDYLRSYALENPAMAVVGLVALLLVLLLVVG